MNGFEADPELLRTAASRLLAAARESAGRAALRYSARPELIGDVLLTAALEDLQRASVAAVVTCLADARELGGRLETSARRYAEYQEEVRDRLERIARDTHVAS